MAYTGRFGQSDDFRREELIRVIEHSVENLTLQELEALYYGLWYSTLLNGIAKSMVLLLSKTICSHHVRHSTYAEQRSATHAHR